MTCSCLPHAAAVQTSKTCWIDVVYKLSLLMKCIYLHIPLHFFVPPIISVINGEHYGERSDFRFLSHRYYSQIWVKMFRHPPCWTLNITWTSCPLSCFCFSLCSDFHPLYTGLKYTICGAHYVCVCVCVCILRVRFVRVATGKRRVDSPEVSASFVFSVAA